MCGTITTRHRRPRPCPSPTSRKTTSLATPMAHCPATAGFADDDDRSILQGQPSQGTTRSEGPDSGNLPPTRRASSSKWTNAETVRLAGSDLVLSCLLPTALVGRVPCKAPLDFSCMRYSAAICDPSEFIQNRLPCASSCLACRAKPSCSSSSPCAPSRRTCSPTPRSAPPRTPSTCAVGKCTREPENCRSLK